MIRSIGAVASFMADQESAQTKGKISVCFINNTSAVLQQSSKSSYVIKKGF